MREIRDLEEQVNYFYGADEEMVVATSCYPKDCAMCSIEPH